MTDLSRRRFLKLSAMTGGALMFSDLAAQYFFGLAIFENAQVRHAFQYGVSIMVFMPK